MKDNKIIKIREIHEVSDISEISVDWNGFNFLVIYGMHVNGWFVAIPNWKVCVEASNPEDVFCNGIALSNALDRHDAGKAIADAIAKHWGMLMDA